MSAIGPRLKKYRMRRGLNVSEVARRLEVSVSTYREWEAGRAIRGEPYLKLAETLEVSLHELFGIDGTARQQVSEDIRAIENLLARIKTFL